MKRHIKSFVLFGVLCLFGAILTSGISSALSFQSRQQVQFSFNPVLSLSISDNLTINNLIPGTYSDSNQISIEISTNVPDGYYLTATAGTSTTDTNLTNTTNSNYYFSSLPTNANVSNIEDIDNNTWGYSFTTDTTDTPTWQRYSGLPLDNNDSGETGKTLINTTDPAESSTIKFKIAAKAADTLPSGTYTNTINFYAISYPIIESLTINDLEYMQEFKTLSVANKASVLASMTTNEQYQLKDSRDEKTYYISKLQDGNVWMTQNLDLDLDNTKTYTQYDTDVPNSWRPIESTSEEKLSTATTHYAVSFDPGDLCWDGEKTSSGSESTIFTEHTSYCTQQGNHYHLGNYYNWSAAVAIEDASKYTTMQDLNQSICPSGWRLPNKDIYQNLINGLSLTAGEDSNVEKYPVYFIYSGVVFGSDNGGWTGDGKTPDSFARDGFYWTSVTSGWTDGRINDHFYPPFDNNEAIDFYFYHLRNIIEVSSLNGFIATAEPMRCVAR